MCVINVSAVHHRQRLLFSRRVPAPWYSNAYRFSHSFMNRGLLWDVAYLAPSSRHGVYATAITGLSRHYTYRFTLRISACCCCQRGSLYGGA